ncbi:hypothetical protein [Sphaerisporangium perillae]|uniref:hypothetical protein n=1 Tax=Sphaerisporangium perillae TaxID=2935860 RepID=UPI00200D5B24|nr:hypothetical protein [Sphaerisporangium perillae]
MAVWGHDGRQRRGAGPEPELPDEIERLCQDVSELFVLLTELYMAYRRLFGLLDPHTQRTRQRLAAMGWIVR